MELENIKAKLESINQNSTYIRVSESHPLELYLGKNEKGYLTLRYNGNFVPTKVLSTNFIEIKQIKTSQGNSILFSFNSEENNSLFYHFCEDIITETEKFTGENDNGYMEIINRYNQWKKMFTGNKKILSENEVIGLIGELMFLKEFIFKNYNITDGLNGWSGPEPTHKDFSIKNEWYEIKAISTFKNTITISSLEQLDSELDGHLVVYQFEKMSSSFNGVTLNNLILEITNELQYEIEKDIFFEKLKQVGYSYNEIYDNYVYNFVERDSYLVDKNFPRIKMIDLPKEIIKVQYELSLSMIEKNKEN